VQVRVLAVRLFVSLSFLCSFCVVSVFVRQLLPEGGVPGPFAVQTAAQGPVLARAPSLVHATEAVDTRVEHPIVQHSCMWCLC
jgi:hypothetical protein